METKREGWKIKEGKQKKEKNRRTREEKRIQEGGKEMERKWKGKK